jgi:hypothetical protein
LAYNYYLESNSTTVIPDPLVPLYYFKFNSKLIVSFVILVSQSLITYTQPDMRGPFIKALCCYYQMQSLSIFGGQANSYLLSTKVYKRYGTHSVLRNVRNFLQHTRRITTNKKKSIRPSN